MRLIKVDVNKIFSVTAIIALLSIFSSLINFLLNIYITRHYSIETVSDYVFIMSLLGIFSMATVLGVDQYVLRELPLRDTEVSTHIVGQVNFVNSIGIVIFGIVFISWLYMKGFSPTIIAMSLVTLAIMGSSFIRRAVCVARGKVQLIQIYDKIVRVLIFAGSLFGCASLVGYRLDTILFSLLISYAISGLLVSHTIDQFGIKYWKFTPMIDSVMLKGAAFLFLSTMFTTVLGQVDVIFVEAFLPKDQTAIYGIAHRFSLVGALMLYSMNIVVLPMLVKAKVNTRKSQEVIRASVIVGVASSLLYLLMIYFFGKYLLSLFGESYTEAYFVLVLLALGQFMNAVFGQTMTLMKIHDMEVTLSGILLLTLLLKCGLASLLVNCYGITGMALSTIFATLFWNILVWRTLYLKIGINPTIFGLCLRKTCRHNE